MPAEGWRRGLAGVGSSVFARRSAAGLAGAGAPTGGSGFCCPMAGHLAPASAGTKAASAPPEPEFSRARSPAAAPAFWLFVALHRRRSIPCRPASACIRRRTCSRADYRATVAATVVSTFSLTAALAGLGFGLIARPIGVRTALAISGAALGSSALLMLRIASPLEAYLRRLLRRRHRRHLDAAAACLGRLFWPGQLRCHPRRGPVAASDRPGLRAADFRPLARYLGSYVLSLTFFAALSFFSALVAFWCARPEPPPAAVAARVSGLAPARVLVWPLGNRVPGDEPTSVASASSTGAREIPSDDNLSPIPS